ncbi:MAG: dUTP diphosphatase [Candidatus Cloacimonadota bacterium]|nr:dUTP diphosphatase [Candidatus Cloacimonadota bacterium]
MKENSKQLTIEIKLSKNAKVPKNHSDFAAGYDIYSANTEEIIIQPNSLKLIPSGFSVSIPAGYEMQIRPRSGLALKHQIGILNSPGTIDADYRGEIGVILYNFGNENFVVKPNMRIAQLVVTKHEVINFEIVKELDKTIRGSGGFGHTKL